MRRRRAADCRTAWPAWSRAALASDNFLRRRDVALASVRPGTKLLDLDAWSIATRLAALLWRSVPDDALLDAARSEALLKPDEVEKQARRMLADPKSERMLTGFFRDWLDVDEASLAQNETETPGMMPALTPALRAGLLRSFDGFASSVFRDDVALGALYSTPQLLADPSLASFYGLTAPIGTGFRVGLTASGPDPPRAADRSGLLDPPVRQRGQQPGPARGQGDGEGLLRGRARTSGRRPRGEAPVRQPECDHARPLRRAPDFPPVRSATPCSIPLGFGLENYDGLGRWRNTDGNQTVNAQGQLICAHGIGQPAPFGVQRAGRDGRRGLGVETGPVLLRAAVVPLRVLRAARPRSTRACSTA